MEQHAFGVEADARHQDFGHPVISGHCADGVYLTGRQTTRAVGAQHQLEGHGGP